MKWKVWGRWVLGLALLTVVFFLGDVRKLTDLRVFWTPVFGMFLTTVAFILLHTLRWKRIVNAISEKGDRGFWPFYKWMLHSYALGYLMPKDVSLLSVRTYYLKHHQNLPLSASLFSVTLDRVLDFIVFFAVIVPALLFITRVLTPVESLVLMGVFVAGLLGVIRWKGERTFDLLIRFYRTILKLPVLRNRLQGKQDFEQYKWSLGENGFYAILTWTVGAYLLLCFRFFLTGLALDVPVTLLQSLFLVPMIQISGIINVTPASLGVLELGSWGALLLIDVPRDQILQFVLGQRVLLTVVLLSVILVNHLFMYLKSRGRGKAGVG